MIKTNSELCINCGLCSKHCVVGLISLNQAKQPQLAANYEQACIQCGQCAAVCPKSAISFSETSIENWENVDNNEQATLTQFSALVKNRRSIRHYQEKLIPQPALLQLLDIARYAPTGGNAQSVKWLVVSGKEKVRELSALCIEWFIENDILPVSTRNDFENDDDIINRGAPHLLIAYAENQATTPADDCVIALRTVELAAQAAGLGSCWAGFFKWAVSSHPAVAEMLMLPENHAVHGALMLGYPKFKYVKIPVRKPTEVTFL